MPINLFKLKLRERDREGDREGDWINWERGRERERKRERERETKTERHCELSGRERERAREKKATATTDQQWEMKAELSWCPSSNGSQRYVISPKRFKARLCPLTLDEYTVPFVCVHSMWPSRYCIALSLAHLWQFINRQSSSSGSYSEREVYMDVSHSWLTCQWMQTSVFDGGYVNLVSA